MDNQRTVLHVLGGLDLGGAEAFVMNLYRNVDRTKIQFDFVVHSTKHFHYEDEATALGAHILRVPRFKGINIIGYIRAWRKLFKDHPNYLAVHGHISSSAAIYLWVAKRFGIYTIAHSHELGITHTLKGIAHSILVYPTRFIADFFFGCSTAAGLSRYGKRIVQSPRFTVALNAIHLEDFTYNDATRKSVRLELGVEHAVVIGHVGRFDPLKNHTFLLAVFKEFLALEPRAHLLLVGDGDEREKIEATIQRLALGPNVTLLGFRSDTPRLLMAMDGFLFPSLAEGLGISLIEAQAVGLVCLASTAVPSEVSVTDLVHFLALHDSAEYWAEQLFSLLGENPRVGRIEELRTHGYDVRSASKQLETFYCSIC